MVNPYSEFVLCIYPYKCSHTHTYTHTHNSEHTPRAVLHPSITLKYYSQVQTQIFVTGSQFCDFVEWAEKDCVVVWILPDADYWTTLLKRAQELFHKVSLPELVSCYYTWQASTKTPVLTELQPCRTKTARTQAHENIQNSGAFAKGLKTWMTGWLVTIKTVQSSGSTSAVWDSVRHNQKVSHDFVPLVHTETLEHKCVFVLIVVFSIT